MSDFEKLYQLRLKVERAYWQLDGTDHEQANTIYDHFGYWGILSREQAESALAMFTSALDKQSKDVL